MGIPQIQVHAKGHGARAYAGSLLCGCLGLLAPGVLGGAPTNGDLHYDDEGEPLTATSNAPQQQATEFMELQAEIEIEQWAAPRSRKYDVRCLVGTKEWFIQGTFRGRDRVSYWFTGTNVIEQVAGAGLGRQSLRKGKEGVVITVEETSSGPRHVATRTDSTDGNPGRPRQHTDLLPAPAELAWLAFCSGRLLKQESRAVFPIGDRWKYAVPYSFFYDDAEFFENKFNLPKQVRLFTPEGQLLFQYVGLNATNLLGWAFPSEFRFAQYRPVWSTSALSTNHWELDFLAKGIVKSIGPAKRTPGEQAGESAEGTMLASPRQMTEPLYEGKPISAWTDELLTLSHIGKATDKRRAAVRAIRSIGTNALPWLLAEMRQVPSLGEETNCASQPDDRHLHQARARFGFWALGEAGAPAIPQLLQLLEKKPKAVPSALAGIGAPALPALEFCLTNAPHYVPPYLLDTVPGSHYAVSALGGLAMALQAGRISKADAEHLVSVVRSWAEDSNKTAAYWARGVLAELGHPE